MKLFSNQGQHLNTNKPAKKSAPAKKTVSSKSTKTQLPPVKAIPSKEDFRILFETTEAVPVVEEPVVPVVEEPVVPVVEEPVVPVVEEPAVPVSEEPVADVAEATVVVQSIDTELRAREAVAAHKTAPASKSARKPDGSVAKTIGLAVAVVALLGILFGIAAFFINALKDTLALQNEILNSDRAPASVTVTPAPSAEATARPVENTPEPTPTAEPTPTPVPVVLDKYAKDAAKNPDMFGWIQIEGTKVDYPVMHTPDDPEKYLYKSFNKIPTASGTPFIDAKCSPDSDNLIIYGHNIKNGTMFNSIIKYESIDYFNEHPVIKFDTIYEEQEYEVMSAFYDRVYYKSETDVFKFYQFIDAEDQAHFDSAVQTLKDKSIYDTGIDAEYGDQLIMLVTCAYHTENGRFVVVARKTA